MTGTSMRLLLSFDFPSCLLLEFNLFQQLRLIFANGSVVCNWYTAVFGLSTFLANRDSNVMLKMSVVHRIR